jgi:hypothetical protein
MMAITTSSSMSVKARRSRTMLVIPRIRPQKTLAHYAMCNAEYREYAMCNEENRENGSGCRSVNTARRGTSVAEIHSANARKQIIFQLYRACNVPYAGLQSTKNRVEVDRTGHFQRSGDRASPRRV